MALPTIATPTFTTKIPSTGQEIEFRPFLVKEEKVLLMALEGGDPNEMMVATKKILQSCIISPFDFDKLATFDVEYLFLKLRGKSVGEVIELRIGHTGDNQCKGKTDIKINIDDIKVDGVTKNMKIMVTDSIGVTVRYPSLKDVNSITGKSEAEGVFKLIAKCIEVVFDEENVYDDFGEEEIVQWLDSLNQKQFQKISDFFQNIPSLNHKVEWKCKECGQTDSFVIEGLHSFFTYL